MEAKKIIKLIRQRVKREVLVAMDDVAELNKREAFSKKETAEMFSITTRTLDRWKDDGKITPLNNVENGKVLYSRKEIVRRLKEMGYGG